MSDTANFLESPLEGCRQGALYHGDFILEHDGAWTSPHSGHVYPTRYHFVVPSEELDIWLSPKLPDQEATEVPVECRSSWGFSPGTRVGRRSKVPITGVPFTAMAVWSSSAFRSGAEHLHARWRLRRPVVDR